MATALLLLNTQMNMFALDPVYDDAQILQRLKDLAGKAQAAAVPVLLVRHGGGPGTPDERGTPGWELHPDLDPATTVIFDQDTPNPFVGTGLEAWLNQHGITRLVVGGMQTELGVDTAVRFANSLGYDVVLVADGHSTRPSGGLTAEQIIAHHNRVLAEFATLSRTADIEFAEEPAVTLGDLSPADAAAVQSGLAEWQTYDRWLATGDTTPYWPHTHPALVADTLHQLWDPAFKLHSRYTDPPPWEMGVARSFMQPLANTPMFVRKQAVQSITKAFDHLLQNPRNPLSPHIRQVADDLYSYDARDIRLFYVPHVTTDKNGRERRYIFLLWAAPGVPERNPFAF